MKFEHPWFLLLLPLLLALWTALVIIAAARRRRKLAALLGNRAGDPEVVRLSTAVRNWKHWLLFAGCAALVLGLARPYWHKEQLPRSADGADVLVIFDVSRSMEAADPAPSRMEQGKYFFRELIKKDKSSRFGLIAFAGTAFQSSPLTSDRKVTEEYIDELSTSTVPLGGTDIEKALTLALQIFDRDKESAHRAVVMITDGDELQGNFQALAKQFKAASIPIAVVGLGSPDKAVTIPDGRGGEVKSAYGETAYTKLNENALRKLAADSGGIYLRSTAFAPGVEEMSRFLEKLPRQKRDIAPAEQPRHTFIYFFLAGFILLILSLLLNERPRAKQAALWIAVLMVCGFQLAADSPAELYNLGRTYQQQGDYENALKCYNSLLASPDAGKEVQNRALLNLGVLRHQQGRKEQQQIKALLAQQKLDEAGKISEQALKTLQNSGEYYSQALTHAGNSDTARKTAANLRQLAYNTAAVKKLQQQIKKLQEQRKKAQQDIKNEQDKNKQQQQQQGKGDKQQQQGKGDKQQQQQQGKDDQQQPSEAEKSAEKLSRDARNLGQQKLADAAEKARQELEKARQSQKQKDFKQAEKHLDNAGKKLAPPPEKSDRKEQKPAGDGKNHSATPAPAKPDPGAADEKKLEILNDANRNMQQRHHDSQQRLRRGAFPPVEKDW